MKLLAPFILLLIALNTQAEVTYESSVLEMQEGFVGEELGVEIEKISIENDQIVIELEWPAVTGELDNLRLLDRSNNPIQVKKSYEVIKDHDNNPKGVVLYLDERHKRAFKIVYDIDDEN